MADKTTYDSEINQAAHRPGQEGAVNRGPQHAVPSEGDERHHVSPPTRSAFGADSVSDPPPKTAPAPAAEPAESGDFGIGGRQREHAITEAVDKAVTG
jgi:hypothetical protein